MTTIRRRISKSLDEYMDDLKFNVLRKRRNKRRVTDKEVCDEIVKQLKGFNDV